MNERVVVRTRRLEERHPSPPFSPGLTSAHKEEGGAKRSPESRHKTNFSQKREIFFFSFGCSSPIRLVWFAMSHSEAEHPPVSKTEHSPKSETEHKSEAEASPSTEQKEASPSKSEAKSEAPSELGGASDYADPRLYADMPIDLSRITANLYLCNFATSQKVSVLREAGIQTIIYLHYLPQHPTVLREYAEAGITHHYLVCYDSPHEKIGRHIRQVCELLATAKLPVLFHCQEGISRSPALLIAFLMHSQQMTFAEATALVKEARPVIRPNDGFEKQLRLFEQQLTTKRG